MDIRCGILAGRGLNRYVAEVMIRLINDPLVKSTWVLLPNAVDVPHLPTGVRPIICPAAGQNHRGTARNALRNGMIADGDYCDWQCLFDDDTKPDPGYFEALSQTDPGNLPLLTTGKLINYDGERCWDICYFREDHHPAVIPYDQLANPTFSHGQYISGPQHLFNRVGQRLKVPYPDLNYGEDTHFSWEWVKAGGKLSIILGISSTLLFQHTPPNYPV